MSILLYCIVLYAEATYAVSQSKARFVGCSLVVCVSLFAQSVIMLRALNPLCAHWMDRIDAFIHIHAPHTPLPVSEFRAHTRTSFDLPVQFSSVLGKWTNALLSNRNSVAFYHHHHSFFFLVSDFFHTICCHFQVLFQPNAFLCVSVAFILILV